MNISTSKNTTNTQKCPTRLLSDLPADDDAFGSHKRVAQAIANVIKEEEGGKAIALTGSWGSGKSTVVNFVKSILVAEAASSTPTQTVFIFDAWSHERDPLRRSFLEKFIDFLSNSDTGWIQERNWKETKEKLAKRLRISETTKVPRLTPGGIILTIAALLVPIGIALLSKTETLPIWLPWWLGGLLSASPLLVILIMLITGWGGGKDSWDSRNEGKRNKRRDILGLLVSRSETKVRNETVETPDPTSIEFQEVFQRILREALKTDENRRLLLVIDNLDRIDPKNALSIWSTMRTFFEQDSQQGHPSWMSRFWLLVPFDPGALSRLWEQKTDESDELVDAFRDKTFQIAFHVSPPVLSDWKDFFQKQFEFAFPAEHHKSDFHIIYRLFHLKGIPKERPPTPRDIKLFINKVGALHRQWKDDIPLPLQALYVLCQSDIQDTESDLAKDDFLEARIVSLIGQTEWQKYLASLHFNVKPVKAIQVLIGRRIEEALSKGNSKDLQEIQNIPSFLEVCEHVVEENYSDWASNEPMVLALAAKALDGLEGHALPAWNHIWKWLRQGAIHVKQWKGINENVGQGIIRILQHTERADYQELAEKILRSLATVEQEDQDKSQAITSKLWLMGALEVVKEVHEAGYHDLVRRAFRVPGDPKFFVDVMADLREKAVSNQILKCFAPPEGQQPQVVAELATTCGEGKLSQSHVDAIDLMMIISNDWPWQELVNALNKRLQGSNKLEPLEITGCLGVITSLAYKGKVPDAKKTLERLSTHGHIAHHLHQAQSANDAGAISLCFLPIFMTIPGGNLQAQAGNSANGINHYNAILKSPEKHAKIVDTLAQLIVNFQKIEDMIQKPDTAAGTEKLVSSVLEKIIKDRDVSKLITSSLLIEHYSAFDRMLSEEARNDLINQLVEKANLLLELEKHGFDAYFAELYLLAFNMSKDQREPSYVDFLLKGIRSLQKEVWLQELSEEGSLLELLLCLVEEDLAVNLSGNFHDALRKHVHGIWGEEVTPSMRQDKWKTLLGAFTDSWKDTFTKNLWDDLIAQPDISIVPVLHLYGDELLHAELTDAQADELVRRMFPEILNRKNMEELFWLSQTLQETTIWKRCLDASRKTFRDRVEDAIREEEATEIKQRYKSIARTIGIDVEKIDVQNDKSAASKEDSEKE
ncbi:MAG: hypothetical protein J7K66_00225 [Anaerolineaceae bacterium]|nr:hypothetical protein [Anaerolineaceae bacterium]